MSDSSFEKFQKCNEFLEYLKKKLKEVVLGWKQLNMAEWELSKENIQPLRQGRKVSAMLDPASDAKKIAEEKQ